MDNYTLQAAQAKKAFLGYDHKALAKKLGVTMTGHWLPCRLWNQSYRLNTADGRIQKWADSAWTDVISFNETMTLLDLVCDSREDRHIRGAYKNMADFGLMFHRQLLEADPWAQFFQDHLPDFCKACTVLGGKPFPKGDAAFVLSIFEDLTVVLQLWLGDDEFPPNLRLLWDENALMYLKYETMYFAKGQLFSMLRKEMNK